MARAAGRGKVASKSWMKLPAEDPVGLDGLLDVLQLVAAQVGSQTGMIELRVVSSNEGIAR